MAKEFKKFKKLKENKNEKENKNGKENKNEKEKVIVNEQYYGSFPLNIAETMLIHLQDQSGKFVGGGKAFIGTLESSYGYGKKIGLISPDFTIRTRIDYDEKEDLVHFNYEDFSDKNNPIKIKIGIEPFSYGEYKRYVNRLNRGLEGSEIYRRFERRYSNNTREILNEKKTDPSHFRKQHETYADPFSDEATLEAKGRSR